MTSAGVALVAGTVSTVLFATSTLPMVLKAYRTKNLASYSLANLVLANIGNAVHSVYVAHLPAGPIWALHSFYVVTSGLMLLWCLRYRRATPARAYPHPQGEDVRWASSTIWTRPGRHSNGATGRRRTTGSPVSPSWHPAT